MLPRAVCGASSVFCAKSKGSAAANGQESPVQPQHFTRANRRTAEYAAQGLVFIRFSPKTSAIQDGCSKLNPLLHHARFTGERADWAALTCLGEKHFHASRSLDVHMKGLM
jgi:hypothetical protein